MLVDWDLDAEWTPERSAVARNIAVWYLRDKGAAELEMEIARGAQYWLPAEGAGVPTSGRGARLAKWVAEGLARARLFYLEPAVGELAIQAGADVRTGPGAFGPPVPYGMVVSPGGLGYTSDGMQLIAAAWQPTETGTAVSGSSTPASGSHS
ncbi:hypothetical protein [Amycolatopsis sp. NPDC004079]|uniref:hypothetical protein n=1 Tax=Amycolatopsis sp. NPDC004079 TaxID=3154549 RepID=UPI0033BB92E6